MENYFTLLGLPTSFDIDAALLEKQYFKLQHEHHPDRFVHKAINERMQNIQKATTINEAYHILKDPLRRAEYLLRLEGVEEVEPDEALLTEAMQQREKLAEAESAADIIQLEKNTENMRQDYIKEIIEAFSLNDFGKVARCCVRLKYLEKLAQEIKLRKRTMEGSNAA